MTGASDTRRDQIREMIADHMLRHGLAACSLRTLAAACGTSDRMLLYYYTDKDALIVAALDTITHRLAMLLLTALPPQALPDAEDELALLAQVLRGKDVRPYMTLWLELVTLAARGVEPYCTVSGAIVDNFIAWVAGRLGGEEATRPIRAARLIATLDGIVLLDLAGRPAISDLTLTPRRAKQL
jgi:AcrR family transcriptional regulator